MTLIITSKNDGMLLTTFPFVKCCSDTCLISRFLVVYSLHLLRLIINETLGMFIFHFFPLIWTGRVSFLHIYRWRSAHVSKWSFRAVAPILTLCSVSFVRFRRAFTLFLREPCGTSQPHMHKFINHHTDVNLTAKNLSSKKKEAASLEVFTDILYSPGQKLK